MRIPPVRWSGLRRVTRINLVIGTVLAVVFAYVGITLYHGAMSQVNYTSNDFPAAQRSATAFLRLSPFERHIGYYNRGTAKAAVGDFDAARTDLEKALTITPERDECAVRINLAYVLEQLADAVRDSDAKKADGLYAQSLDTLEKAPKECRPKGSDEQKKGDGASKRVEEKKEENSNPDGSKSDSGDGSGQKSDPGKDGSDSKDQSSGGSKDQDKKDPSTSDGSSDSSADGQEKDGQKSEAEKKREELRKRGQSSQRDQQEQGTGSGGDGGRSIPDKPW